MRSSFIGGYVLWETMFYMKACLTGRHVLQEYTGYEWICDI